MTPFTAVFQYRRFSVANSNSLTYRWLVAVGMLRHSLLQRGTLCGHGETETMANWGEGAGNPFETLSFSQELFFL